ncbi:MAG: hypothetical protein K0B10_09880 [Vicingaceae bacterium]|nr:hypothetical protein [Vicingaceae bacterium]
MTTKAQCNDQLLIAASEKLESFIYVKDFKIKLKEVKAKKDPENVTYTVILNKDMKYRFIIEDAKDFPGRMIFELYGDRGKIMSSYNPGTKKHYTVLEYNCTKTGIHYINVGFQDKQEGCGVLVYSFNPSCRS